MFRATFSSSPKGVSPVDNGETLDELMKQFTGTIISATYVKPDITQF